MKIGHINLAQSFNGTGEHFVALVEALDRQGIRQHIIVRNNSLARRVAVCDNVVVGPVTASPVVAYCLMPQVEVVHVHNEKSAQSGLLLTLTRSIPFVLTSREPAETPGDQTTGNKTINNTVSRSIRNRAASVICNSERAAQHASRRTSSTPVDVIADIARSDDVDFDMLGNRVAAKHMRIYRRAADAWRMPALLG